MNSITMKLNADHLIQQALAEDITSEDITTNAVMPDASPGEVELICKQDGIICGLDVFMRVFSLLDENTEFDMKVKDGDKVTKGQLMGIIKGDMLTQSDDGSEDENGEDEDSDDLPAKERRIKTNFYFFFLF